MEVVTVSDQRLADDADALADLRRCVLAERFVENVLVDAFDLLTTEFLRPRHPEPSLCRKLLHEGTAFGGIGKLAEVLAVMVHDFVVMIIDQPRFDLVCEFLFFREEIKFH